MPWWFYVLAVLWSVPIVAIIGVVAYAFISEARRNKRIMARRDEGEARLSERYLSDRAAEWREPITTLEGLLEYDRNGSRIINDGHDVYVDMGAYWDGQGSNPRARP